MKVDSSSKIIYCTRCASQWEAENAFVFYDLRHADQFDIDAVDSCEMLVTCGKALLEQKRYDQADLCFLKASEQEPENYYIWRLRAFILESKVVNELKQSFYLFDKEKKVLVENSEYLNRYKELCKTAVRHCPSDMSGDLAEEFNDRIREHFNLAFIAYDEERKKRRNIIITAALILFCAIAIGLRTCSG